MPYTTIPSKATFELNSRVVFAFRSSDVAIVQMDALLEIYATKASTNDKARIAFHLLNATRFWLAKVDQTPANQAPSGDTVLGEAPSFSVVGLPSTVKLAGSPRRRTAVRDLHDIVVTKLRQWLALAPHDNLDDFLWSRFGLNNRGLVADNHWLGSHPHDLVTTAHFTDPGQQKRYKLRFRDGLAYRYMPGSGQYELFDTRGNADSEINDQMTHFVMDRSGRIYAGFDKMVVWFKHSSLVGGRDAFGAGRMQVVDGTVTVIENDSGHYHPDRFHITNVLLRLQLYGQDLSGTRILRHGTTDAYDATDLLEDPSAVSWP